MPDRSMVLTEDTGPSDAVTQLAKGADMLVSEATNPVDEFKESQIKQGAWQSKTPEEQAGLIRHHIEEHLLPEEIGKIGRPAPTGSGRGRPGCGSPIRARCSTSFRGDTRWPAPGRQSRCLPPRCLDRAA
jgi:hypothetical protein